MPQFIYLMSQKFIVNSVHQKGHPIENSNIYYRIGLILGYSPNFTNLSIWGLVESKMYDSPLFGA